MAVVFLATDTGRTSRSRSSWCRSRPTATASRCSKPSAGAPRCRRSSAARAATCPAVYEHGTHGPYFFIAMEYLERAKPLRGHRRGTDAGRARRARGHASCASSCKPPTPSSARSTGARSICSCTATSSRGTSACSPTTRSRCSTSASPRRCRSAARSRATTSAASRISRPSASSRARSTPRPSSGRSGVLLYEMVSGVQPFRAADTRRLEQRIRARQLPASLDGACPAGLQAIVAKLLAPAVADRYGSATAIRDDLQRFASRRTGPGRARGLARSPGTTKPVTRRTHRAPVTLAERCRGHAADRPGCADRPRRRQRSSGADRDHRPALAPSCTRGDAGGRDRSSGDDCGRGSPAPRFRRLRWLRSPSADGDRHRHGAERDPHLHHRRRAWRRTCPQEIGGVIQMWNQQRRLTDGSLNIGVAPLERALVAQAVGALRAHVRALSRRRRDGVRTGMAADARRARSFAVGPIRRTRQLRPRCATATATCGGSTARRALKAKQAAAAQQELTAAVARFARPPSCGRTGPIRSSA